jgi:hypothetical protein
MIVLAALYLSVPVKPDGQHLADAEIKELPVFAPAT